MTKEEKPQIALDTYLLSKWKERNKLHAEGNKLHAEGNKLYKEKDRLREEGHELYKKGSKLYVKGSKLHEESYKLYKNAVVKVYGKKAIINWKDGSITFPKKEKPSKFILIDKFNGVSIVTNTDGEIIYFDKKKEAETYGIDELHEMCWQVVSVNK